jgi:myo-inositol-1(or 4)-monophosphatase
MMGELILKIRNLRTSGSAFDVSLLVKGKYGAILNRTSKIWDNVAPQILIEEAGGLYTDFFGHPVEYSQPLTRATQNFTCCTASQTLHTQIQQVLKPFAP